MSSSERPVLPEELIRDNLYNWLGYGNLNGKYWFIGREEYDSINRCEKLDDIQDYYRVRRSFDYAEDFVDVWENEYGRSIEAGAPSLTTRHYQAAFMISFGGKSPGGQHSSTGRSKTSSFVFHEKRFGRTDGNHFSGEVYPLRYHPDKPQTFDPYRNIWESPEEYKKEVHPKRIDLYLQQLRANNNVEVIINYAGETDFTLPLKKRLKFDVIGNEPANKKNQFQLYRCYMEDDRTFILVDSPFLGQGHVGYSEIENLAEKLDDHIISN